MKTEKIDDSRKIASEPKVFFLFALLFASLSFVAFGTGAILFQLVNKYFPDSLLIGFGAGFDQSSVRFGIASVLVAAPIYFWLSRYLAHMIDKELISRDSKTRRWLTYVVLFVAATVIAGDLITLAFNFLEGDIAARFLLKVLIILSLSGAIFSYYFADIRKIVVTQQDMRRNALIGYAASVFVILVFAAAFFVIDPPSIARDKKIDTTTVSDLQSIESSVRSYHSQFDRLPNNLEELESAGLSPFLSARSGSIEYDRIDENSFRLCADFLQTDDGIQNRTFSGFESPGWRHDKGRVCFERVTQLPADKPLVE